MTLETAKNELEKAASRQDAFMAFKRAGGKPWTDEDHEKADFLQGEVDGWRQEVTWQEQNEAGLTEQRKGGD